MTENANSSPPPKSGSRRSNAIPLGHLLDEYRVDEILGAGGFGITYKALDTHLNRWVAIKEYFPVEWSFRDADGVTVHSNTQGQNVAVPGNQSDYRWGLERFLDEARVLAQIEHPLVVQVKRYFEANGTAYIVMDYEEGEPLSAILREGETLTEDEMRGLLEDVLPALQAVHDQNFLHRDIKPSNLYVRASDQKVMLIDFGSARTSAGRHSQNVTSMVTPGYSPPEQYTTRTERYGTWTDMYALGAVLYRAITGRTPAEAADRLLEDTQIPAVEVGAGRYSTNVLRVIDRALAIRPEYRFRDVAEMQAALEGAEDDGDETVIIPVPMLAVKRGADEESPRITGRPLSKPVRAVENDWMNHNTRPPTVEPVEHIKSGRSGLLAILGAGIACIGAAVAAFFFWTSAPEQTPPSNQGITRQEQPAVIPIPSPLPARDAIWKSPPTTSGFSSSGSENTPVVPSAVTTMDDKTTKTAVEGKVSGTAVDAATSVDMTSPLSPIAPIVPLEKPTTPVLGGIQASDETAPVGQTGEQTAANPAATALDVGETATGLPGVVPALVPMSGSTPATSLQGSTQPAESTESTTAKPAEKPVQSTAKKSSATKKAKPSSRRTTKRAKSSSRRVKNNKRKPRKKRVSKKKLKPIVITPARQRRAAPSPRNNPWDAPTSSGFNSK